MSTAKTANTITLLMSVLRSSSRWSQKPIDFSGPAESRSISPPRSSRVLTSHETGIIRRKRKRIVVSSDDVGLGCFVGKRTGCAQQKESPALRNLMRAHRTLLDEFLSCSD